MRFLSLTAPAVLLLASTALSVREAETNLESVYVDVDGIAVQVSVALAAEACGQDEAAIQQLALTRSEESGLDPAMLLAGGATIDAEAGGVAPEASNETVTTAQGTADPTPQRPARRCWPWRCARSTPKQPPRSASRSKATRSSLTDLSRQDGQLGTARLTRAGRQGDVQLRLGRGNRVRAVEPVTLAPVGLRR